MSGNKNTVAIFLCHEGELSEPPESVGAVRFVPLDLRQLRPFECFAFDFSRLAEARAFATPDLPSMAGLTHVGFMSWRMPQKRNDGTTWSKVGMLASSLSTRMGFAPYYWSNPMPDLAAQADSTFPGMGKLIRTLDELAPQFDLKSSPNSMQVAGNSFVVPVDTYLHFASFTRQILEWTVWLQPQSVFGYRCNRCGEVSYQGIGRYRKNRDIALFLEHATIYFFQRQSTDLEFCSVPGSKQTSVRRARERLQRKLLGAASRSPCAH